MEKGLDEDTLVSRHIELHPISVLGPEQLQEPDLPAAAA